MFNNPLQGSIDGQAVTIQQDGMVRFGGDDRINVTFYRKAVLDVEESRRHGAPFRVAQDYVRIQHPGERDYVDRPVTDMDKHRWVQKWQQYSRNQEQVPDGTPIDTLLPTFPDIAANLHEMGIHTVEQMADITAEGMQRIGMGGQQLQNKAKKFLEHAQKGVALHQMEKALADRDSKIEVLSNQVALLKGQLDRTLAQLAGVPNSTIPVAPPSIAAAYSNTLNTETPVDYRQINQGLQQNFESSVAREGVPRRGRPPGSKNRPK